MIEISIIGGYYRNDLQLGSNGVAIVFGLGFEYWVFCTCELLN